MLIWYVQEQAKITKSIEYKYRVKSKIDTLIMNDKKPWHRVWSED